MKVIFQSIVASMVLLMSNVMADQAAYITLEQSKEAVQLLEGTQQVRFFCAPCGDKQSELVAVSNIKNVHTGYENYWEVRINNKGIDLAYTYYHVDGKWRNIAISLNIDVEGVPNYLDKQHY